MSIPAFAEENLASGGGPSETTYEMEGSLTGGSITIDNAVVGQTYSAYQILYLESYNSAAKAYSYKANSAWATWLNGEDIKNVYVNIDAHGYVTWVEGANEVAFAKLAQVEAAKMTTSLTEKVAKDKNSVTFSDLKLGYYLVDTSLGTLCFLNTTNPTATIEEKNSVPTIEKQVKEDSTGKYGDSNTAKIGDTINFKSTITAFEGAKNYVVHDKMDAGLTFNSESIVITEGTKTLEANTDYTVKTGDGISNGCTFEIEFKQSYLDTIGHENKDNEEINTEVNDETSDSDTKKASVEIVIQYTAVLNNNAVIYDQSNKNKTMLNYGDKIGEEYTGETEWDETKTYTFMFDIVKTDADKKLLTGAKFELYDAETGGKKIALVEESEDNCYRVATEAEKTAEGFTSAVIEAGKVTVKGLDANTTYWLEETEAPAGYNKLAGRVKVEIKEENLTATMTGDNDDTWSSGGAHIVNNTGTELPSTGGIGTTVFYAAGVILALGAAVVLVARRRMRTE